MDTRFTTIYLTRHGQSEGNVKQLMQGHQDYVLTAHGEEQAKQTGTVLKDIQFAAVYSSDLLRAYRTAEIIALERKLAVNTTKALRERTFGAFENMNYDEFDTFFAKQHTLIKTLTTQEQLSFRYAPDIETDEELIGRTFTFIREISLLYRGKNVLIMSHGGVLYAALVHLGLASRKTTHEGIIGNAGYIKMDCDGVDFYVRDLYNIDKTNLANFEI